MPIICSHRIAAVLPLHAGPQAGARLHDTPLSHQVLSGCLGDTPGHVERSTRQGHGKVYKYKVVSTKFNDDIFGIEIIYLEEMY
jgi:hypothetical protein